MMTIHTNNLVTLNGAFVGRIHADDAHARPPTRNGSPTRFYTSSKAGSLAHFDVEHLIAAPVYVMRGGPSDWIVNPAFEKAVGDIIAGLAK